MTSRTRLRLVGRSPRKVDALDKALGRAKYTDDLSLPRMLHGKLLRCPHPHAELVSVDLAPALALPGVLAAIAGADLPARYGILPVTQDESALASGAARYAGEPVAAVAAVDEPTAERALGLIRVAYHPLPARLGLFEAAAAPAAEGRLHRTVSYEFGAWPSSSRAVPRGEAGSPRDGAPPAEEPEHRREDLFFYEGNTHLPLEQHAALASWKGGRLSLICTSQTPFHLRRIAAKVFGLPEERVRVIVPKLGGGFGGKLDPFSHDLCAAELARRAGRPVKIALTREEVFYCHRGRHPSLMRTRSAWRKDGRLLELDFEACLDGGAYGSFGVVCTYYHGALQPTTYRIPRYRFRAARWTTNKPPCGPKRGHGIPQPRCALEIHLDKVAAELGLDPIELRLRNLAEPGELTVNGLRLGSSGLRRCVELAAKDSGWSRRRGRLAPGRGLGFALGSYLSGAGVPIYWNEGPHSQVRVVADRTGVTVYSGTTDIGQGSDTVIVTMVAEVLGLELGEIRLVAADTALTPPDLGSYSSRVTMMGGNAAKRAAEALLAKVRAAGGPGPFRAALRRALRKRRRFEALGGYRPPERPVRFKGSGVGVSPAYSFSACVAEVDCDAQTGAVRVAKIWFAHDIGRAVNRAAVLGQIEGGIYMGLGEALYEEQGFTAGGLLRRPSLLEYTTPGIADMPELSVRLVESGDAEGPYGAKEVGQGPLLPVIPAVANAIHDALGVRIDSTPFTPEKVLAALERKAAGRPARVGPESFPAVAYPEPIRVRVDLPSGEPAPVEAAAGARERN